MPGPLLLVFAHPDDESSSVAGTVAKYAGLGIPVDLVTATGGEKGARVGIPEGTATAEVREAELRKVAALIGIRDIYLLDYIDAELDRSPLSDVAGKIAEIMRRTSPQAVITFGPDGVSRHPDHIAVSHAATQAFFDVQKTGHAPQKLYYVTLPESMLDEIEDIGEGEVYARPDEEINTAIDITGYLETKIKALKTHRSQEDAQWLAGLFRKGAKSAWGQKEFLFRAYPEGPEKETDIFSL